MVVTNELKEAAPVIAPVALNRLSVNVFTALGKADAALIPCLSSLLRTSQWYKSTTQEFREPRPRKVQLFY